VIIDNFTPLGSDIIPQISGNTITVAGTGYTRYQWYVDNLLRETGSSITLEGYAAGTHTVAVTVYKNNIPYSAETTFTVQ
jgi:hypothetical protein